MVAADGRLARFRLCLCLLVCLLVLPGSSRVGAQDDWTSTHESVARLQGPLPAVRVELPFTDVHVRGRADGDAVARLVYRVGHDDAARRDQIASQTRLVWERAGEGTRLKVEGPLPGLRDGARADNDRRASVALELFLELPAGTALDVTSLFGDVEIEELDGDVRVRGGSGAVRVRNLKGDATLAVDFGDEIDVDGAGRVEIQGRNAGVRLRRVQSATVHQQFADVVVHDVAEDLTIQGSHADVRVEGVGGSLHVVSNFGDVTVRDPGDTVRIQTQGTVDVVAAAIPAGAHWSIETAFHPVRLAVPATANASVRVASQFGPLESEFPMQRTHGWDEEGHVQLGGGEGATIEVRNTAGIHIRRWKEEEE